MFAINLSFDIVDALTFHATFSVDADVVLSAIASEHSAHKTKFPKDIGNATSLYVALIVNDALPHCLPSYSDSPNCMI